MPWTEYRDDCPGCRPVVFDPVTFKPEPEDGAVMQAVNRLWAVTSRATKESFHNVTCNNSRAPADMLLVERFIEQMQKAISKP